MISELYKIYLQSAGVTTDSRMVGKGSVFFALKGDRFDGNLFAAEAIEKGALLAVTDKHNAAAGQACLQVPDVLETLQQLATHHRNQLDIPLIGITGSNGKTTTRELIQRVLKKKYTTAATSGNLNNHIGVPLSILGIKPDSEIAVVEMGANHIGEIAMLCRIAQPTHGLVTNIGKAHLEGFGSHEGVIRAKSELYEFLKVRGGKAYVNADDPLLTGLASPLTLNTYGTDAGADVKGRIVGSSPFLEIDWGGRRLVTQLYGDYNFYNAMAAICIGASFGVEEDDIADAVSSYVPANNRSQVVESGSNTIFLDAYNANPTSMLAAIRHFGRQAFAGKLIILGDMLELGPSSEEEHKAIISELERQAASAILIGPKFSAANADNNHVSFPDVDHAATWLNNHPPRGKHILIKGSRGMQLERLLKKL
jgi:UDP-N-acetylmuramoyl-tripeptide--D-alanyl-D-alanine ligase